MTESSSKSSSRVATFTLPEFASQSFSITHEFRDQGLVVILKGNADSDAGPPLSQYLERLHEEVAKAGLREVTLDFRELYFLTSSCIKHLVVAIKRVMALDARQQYKIVLATQPNLHWQERSFVALCQIAPLLVSMQPST